MTHHTLTRTSKESVNGSTCSSWKIIRSPSMFAPQMSGPLSSPVLRSWHSNQLWCQHLTLDLGSPWNLYATLVLWLCSHSSFCIALSQKSRCLGQSFKFPEERNLGIYYPFLYSPARPGRIYNISHRWNKTFKWPTMVSLILSCNSSEIDLVTFSNPLQWRDIFNTTHKWPFLKIF